jgi:hypothetical protein
MDESAAFILLRAAREISYSQRRSLRNNRCSPAHPYKPAPEMSGLRGEALRPRDFSHRRTDAKSLISFLFLRFRFLTSFPS